MIPEAMHKSHKDLVSYRPERLVNTSLHGVNMGPNWIGTSIRRITRL